jgi:hypothetical protein
VSDLVTGLTIVAVGASLPELAPSAMAAYKKNAEITVGNVVGSNIFNLFRACSEFDHKIVTRFYITCRYRSYGERLNLNSSRAASSWEFKCNNSKRRIGLHETRKI